jgi:hypothetical protein
MKEIVIDYNNQKWYDMGVKVAKLGQMTMAQQFFAGIAETTGTEGVTDIKTCITDIEAVVKDVETAVTDFKTGQYKNGIEEIIATVGAVKTAEKDCVGSKYPRHFSRFHQSKIAMNVNTEEFLEEIKATVEDFKKANWYDLGVQFA